MITMPKRKERKYTFEWYSENSGAECFSVRDEKGRIVAQVKVHDDKNIAQLIVAALTKAKVAH